MLCKTKNSQTDPPPRPCWAGDFHVINGILRTAHSLFERYRYEFKSNELWTEIKFVLDNFAKPLTELFVVSCGLLLRGTGML